jgi:cytochrome c-type biogenesis protein CcmE
MNTLKSKGKWFAIGSLAVAAAGLIAITAGGIGENLVYYWGPTELHTAGDKAYGATIRLGGQVKPGTIRFDSDHTKLQFQVTDGRNDVAVLSSGVPPQMFRENIGVVVEGTYTRKGVFESNRLMVSHGNEYKAPGEGEAVDTKKLMQTTEGVDPEAVKGAS